MLDLTRKEIAELSDTDLRALIGLLCEADLRCAQLPPSAVTWGGHQNAPDCGIDVHVSLPEGTGAVGFIPRAQTGIQVKASNIDASGIAKEMRPRSHLRPSIAGLATAGGAYIIIASKSSVSARELPKRRAAMRRALGDLPDADKLHTDFLDGDRVATWVRCHPGLILWVRAKIGRSITGWQPFGPWAHPAENVDVAYLTDDMARLLFPDARDGRSIIDGLNGARKLLSEPRRSVRLVGLSGVGKTRFAQALFDERVGSRALPRNAAIYTNLNDSPAPHPVAFLTELIALGHQAIVVVDNCPLELHRRLTEIAAGSESRISLLTVEYDVRDDQPEDTDVLTLCGASDTLIETLIAWRYPQISQTDRETIARFSEGNARVALALACTLKRGDSLAGLRDEDLFKRLFHQRDNPNEDLLKAAEVLSLLYSFEGEALDGEEAELPVLGGLIGHTAIQLYRHVADLEGRQLVQRRGVWRAVLPHAIANRLAARALANIPISVIDRILNKEASRRVRQSFARRLGYLHSSPQAVALVERWLAPEGCLAKAIIGSDAGNLLMFRSIAPVAPDHVLACVERALDGDEGAQIVSPDNWHRGDLVKLLRQLAYDATLFDRSAALLVRFAEVEGDSQSLDRVTSVLASLFQIRWSGTEAPLSQRMGVIGGLLGASPERRRLGLRLLATLLQAENLGSAGSFEFGARSRDYGYWPESNEEIAAWYRHALGSVSALMDEGAMTRREAETLIASAFGGLWQHGFVEEELETIARSFGNCGFWYGGWRRIRSTLRFAGKKMTVASHERLKRLEVALRPANLVQWIEAVVLNSDTDTVDLTDTEDFAISDTSGAYARLQRESESLGEQAAVNPEALQTVLQRLVSGEHGRQYSFGIGLARAVADPATTWSDLTGAYAQTEPSARRWAVMCGYLFGLHKRMPGLAATLLDRVLADPVLAPILPNLQSAVPIDAPALVRLHRCLADGLTDTEAFRVLAWGGALNEVSPSRLKTLLSAIAAKPGGVSVALEILHWQLVSSEKDLSRSSDPDLKEAGLAVLSRWTPACGGRDHELDIIMKTWVTGADGAAVARSMCEQIKIAMQSDIWQRPCWTQTLEALFRRNGMIALEVFYGGDADHGSQVLGQHASLYGNPLGVVPLVEVIRWCDNKPALRYPLVAEEIPFFTQDNDAASRRITDLSYLLLEHAPDPAEVIRAFATHIWPNSWSGSRAQIMETRANLLRELTEHSDPRVAAATSKVLDEMDRHIRNERAREERESRMRDERFEPTVL